MSIGDVPHSPGLKSVYKLTYLGHLQLDRRYTLAMLPWIMCEVRRTNAETLVSFQITCNSVKCFGADAKQWNHLILDHNLLSIVRFVRSGGDVNLFAYLERPSPEETFTCHVFYTDDQPTILDIINDVQAAAKITIQQQELDDHKNSNGVFHPVQYKGKLRVNDKKSVASTIDSLAMSDTHIDNHEKESDQKSSGLRMIYSKSLRSSSVDTTDTSTSERRSSITVHEIGLGPVLWEEASLDISVRDDMTDVKLQMHIKNHDLAFINPVTSELVMVKRFKEISYCSQGFKSADYFGFVCREQCNLESAPSYWCYVFSSKSESSIDRIMLALRNAFQIALKNKKHIICTKCPMHWFHRLCLDVESEGNDFVAANARIIQGLATFDMLDDDDVEQYIEDISKYDFIDQNEILMTFLRKLSEELQKGHVDHSSHTRSSSMSDAKDFRIYDHCDIVVTKENLQSLYRTEPPVSDDVDGDERGNTVDGMKENQPDFNHHLNFDRTPQNDSCANRISLDVDNNEGGCHTSYLNNKDHFQRSNRPNDLSFSPKSISGINMPNDGTGVVGKDITLDFVVAPLSQIKHGPLCNEKISSGTAPSNGDAAKTKPPPIPPKPQLKRKNMQKQVSFRQAIYSSVVACDADPVTQVNRKISKSSDEYKEMWRKAIVDQIILLRMERENRKLMEFQDAALLKRMKLGYQDCSPCLSDVADIWDQEFSQLSSHDPQFLLGLVKAGVPKLRRGEVWQLLKEQYQINHSDPLFPCPNLVYKELLGQSTSHQHSILIDISRTFPTHPYYEVQLGKGQIALFNILKVYSLCDEQVGYCQGLSFVAGILLIHLEELEAFAILTFLMFHLGLRKQYMPDMVQLQIHMYQLSRLLHDCNVQLYDHLEKYDINPTLYATPWFLTVFSSQFPMGFVSRIFDLIFLEGPGIIFKVAVTVLCNNAADIMALDSFETLVHYLQNQLPKSVISQVDKILSQVIAMKLSDKLASYEIEYQVLQESTASIHTSNYVNKLKEDNKLLANKNTELTEYLQISRIQMTGLEQLVLNMQETLAALKKDFRSVEKERDDATKKLALLVKEPRTEAVSCHKRRKRPDRLENIVGIPGLHQTYSSSVEELGSVDNSPTIEAITRAIFNQNLASYSSFDSSLSSGVTSPASPGLD